MDRYIARLVAKGYTQKERALTIMTLFLPLLNSTQFGVLCLLLLKKGWCIQQSDVNNALFHGDLHEEMYMQLHLGHPSESKHLVYKLNKSLYGLKQASRQLYAKLSNTLHEKEYVAYLNDYSLFLKKGEQIPLPLLLFTWMTFFSLEMIRNKFLSSKNFLMINFE